MPDDKTMKRPMLSSAAKTNLFRSHRFRVEIGDQLDRPRPVVDRCIDALLDARSIAAACEDDGMATLAADGARIILAISGQQDRPDSVVRVGRRLGEMTLFMKVGRTGPVVPADIMTSLPTGYFAEALAALVENVWSATESLSASGFLPTFVSMTWCDERGDLLFGTIEQKSTGRRLIFSNAVKRPALFDDWDFTALPKPIGGSEFTPFAVIGFAKARLRGVAGDAASDI